MAQKNCLSLAVEHELAKIIRRPTGFVHIAENMTHRRTLSKDAGKAASATKVLPSASGTGERIAEKHKTD
jgi:hypothetical protein